MKGKLVKKEENHEGGPIFGKFANKYILLTGILFGIGLVYNVNKTDPSAEQDKKYLEIKKNLDSTYQAKIDSIENYHKLKLDQDLYDLWKNHNHKLGILKSEYESKSPIQ